MFSSACGDDKHAAPDAPVGADAALPDAPPPPPGLTLLDYTFAIDVTPDGHTALFENLEHDGTASVVLYDTFSNTGATKTSLPDPSKNIVTGISQNSVVSAYRSTDATGPVDAATWDETRGWTVADPVYTPGCDRDRSGAFDISADGKVTTGLLWHGCSVEAFRWTDTGGTGTMAMLQIIGNGIDIDGDPSTPRVTSDRGTVISTDGKVIAGFAANNDLDRTPAIWNEAGTGTLLAPNLSSPNDAPGEVTAINGDGSILAGALGADVFVWTQATGMVTAPRPGTLDPTDGIHANAMTADGQYVFGGVAPSGDLSLTQPYAYVLTLAKGHRPITDIVKAAGITVPDGWTLGNVNGVSSDGTVVVGTAYMQDPNTGFLTGKAFVLRVAPGTWD